MRRSRARALRARRMPNGIDGEELRAIVLCRRKESADMKGSTKTKAEIIQQAIMFIRGVANRNGDRKSLAAGKLVEAALRALGQAEK